MRWTGALFGRLVNCSRTSAHLRMQCRARDGSGVAGGREHRPDRLAQGMPPGPAPVFGQAVDDAQSATVLVEGVGGVRVHRRAVARVGDGADQVGRAADAEPEPDAGVGRGRAAECGAACSTALASSSVTTVRASGPQWSSSQLLRVRRTKSRASAQPRSAPTRRRTAERGGVCGDSGVASRRGPGGPLCAGGAVLNASCDAAPRGSRSPSYAGNDTTSPLIHGQDGASALHLTPRAIIHANGASVQFHGKFRVRCRRGARGAVRVRCGLGHARDGT